mmetsp:Transcript_73752/g.196007  ORF Transcript_73752/g.196007 Transcript_73752/m.196007 type:complete len:200 (-) Transcript_73752:812-1411(-)
MGLPWLSICSGRASSESLADVRLSANSSSALRVASSSLTSVRSAWLPARSHSCPALSMAFAKRPFGFGFATCFLTDFASVATAFCVVACVASVIFWLSLVHFGRRGVEHVPRLFSAMEAVQMPGHQELATASTSTYFWRTDSTYWRSFSAPFVLPSPSSLAAMSKASWALLNFWWVWYARILAQGLFVSRSFARNAYMP